MPNFMKSQNKPSELIFMTAKRAAPHAPTLTGVVIASPRACTYIRSCLLAIRIGHVLSDGASQLFELRSIDTAALGYSHLLLRLDTIQINLTFSSGQQRQASLLCSKRLGAIVRDRGPLESRTLSASR